jgi:hypothetical protein
MMGMAFFLQAAVSAADGGGDAPAPGAIFDRTDPVFDSTDPVFDDAAAS